MLLKASDVCLAWELITAEETLKNENPKNTLAFELFSLLFFILFFLQLMLSYQLQRCTVTRANIQSHTRNEGQDHFLWSMADGEKSSSSPWTLYRRVDFERLQCTPKDYQCKISNCRAHAKTRITDELIKHISCVKLPSCWSKLFNSTYSDCFFLCSPENKSQVHSLNPC